MSQIVIAKRYAKALINLTEGAQLEPVRQDLLALSDLYQGSLDLQQTLDSSKVLLVTKINILTDVMGTSAFRPNPLVQTFARFLLTKRRFMLLPDIAKAFSQLVQEKLGRLAAKVTVAKELDQSEVSQLEKELSKSTGKQVSVTQSTQPEILGGVITRIGSVVIDGSLRIQLNRIRQTIIRG